MVLVKRICPPERRKAIIAVSATPSTPTLSVSESDTSPPFQLRISLRIAETTRPGHAITIRTDGTVFCPSVRGHEEGENSLDTAARGTISLVSTTDPSSRRISLGKFLTHEAHREDPPPDMRDQPWAHLLTIPAEGSVEVTHDLPVSRLFLHEHKLTRDDVVGETWRLGLNDGYVGTTWWCWGDLEGDLAGKHLSPWHEGMRVSPKPEVGEDWVLGLQPMELVFQDESKDGGFQFVE
ncbi:hypothetical protein SLS64_005114 [Diaporthe eres]|uniref:Uncharacterized protein n=1 Tax=Diaporthe eres TaxID=83184 RepID=A0ABR1P5L6_DIAER